MASDAAAAAAGAATAVDAAAAVGGALQLLSIPNARDLSEAHPDIVPGRVLRCACPLPASESDVQLLRGELGITHMIDLRSKDEREEDACSLLLGNGGDGGSGGVGGTGKGSAAAGGEASLLRYGREGRTMMVTQVSSSGAALSLARPLSFESDARWGAAAASNRAAAEKQQQQQRLTVHQIALLNKTRYFSGLMWRLSPGTVAAVAAWSLWDRERSRQLLIDQVNAGRLDMLYEIILETARPEVCTALQVLTTSLEAGHRVAFFCKVGKDRTGILAALALSCAGATKKQVLDDYTRSDEHHAVALGGLEKDARLQGLAWDVFSRAPRDVMERTLHWIGQRHGSVHGYLDDISFDTRWRARLAAALKEPAGGSGGGKGSGGLP